MKWVVLVLIALGECGSLAAQDVPAPMKGFRVTIKKGRREKTHEEEPVRPSASPSLADERRPVLPPPATSLNGACPYGKVPYTHARKIGLSIWADPSNEPVPGLAAKLKEWNDRYKQVMGDAFEKLECSAVSDPKLKKFYEEWGFKAGLSKRFVYCDLKLCIPEGKRVVERTQKRRNAASVNFEVTYQNKERSGQEQLWAKTNALSTRDAWRNWESDYFQFLRERKKRDENVVGMVVIQPPENYRDRNSGPILQHNTAKQQPLERRDPEFGIQTVRSNGSITMIHGDISGVYFDWEPVELVLE